ncbi:GH92 family glycosyl hydrolase [Dinghuibacter silviterrae]|uniref:Putative alpha-1,2-mannosidase n=1 Tax=Dinghuibacter silviterrae TaxID=1539049 RepID=A0A4R8DGX1_9BACT|nr:GH92 family glycosyl hydrolase [Dinghuibacter silviterrae]TDW96931.1 putative alpha-1,2-mannosidase [Dinghuibacter silviterrae]
MKNGFVLLMIALCLSGSTYAQDSASAVDYIDPTIGNVGRLLEPTRPTVQLPNQMIRFTPQRKDYMDDQISSFPLCIVSHRLGEVFGLKPSVAPAAAGSAAAPSTAGPGTAPALSAWGARQAYDHDLEVNRPWYYSTFLLDDGITLEFTAGRKVGCYRFHFPAQAPAKSILFNVYNDGPSQWSFPKPGVVTGMETYHENIKVFMYGVFSRSGATGVLPGDRKAYITFPSTTTEVTFRYAISYVSPEQAQKNYEEENRSFDELAAAGKKAWERVVGQIRVEGGTPAQRRSFYTALYRCHERMVDITEDGQYYSGYDMKVHQDTRPFYVDDWSWDTYLALHPLRMILHPDQEQDMLQSYVRMYSQSGWMPTFPVLFGDNPCMNGFHSSVVFLDAYRKGLRHFDIEEAYAGMRKNAVQATMLPWRNGEKTVLDDFYYTHGYFPALHPEEKETVEAVHPFEKRQAVAVTLGASYDDWALSGLASDLGKKDDAAQFAARALNFRNLWDSSRRFFMPKDAEGNWINIDPAWDGGMGGRDYYDENNGWTYLWQVQENIPELVRLMGGRKAFEDRLDELFRTGLGRSKFEFWAKFPDATGLTGQHSMGNEPGFVIPYLYNVTDAPWKTQARVRFLLDAWFKDNIFGIPGDEDGGGMSAFVVFSSMGFYPMTPGLPRYTIGSPVFSKVSIALANGKTFTIIARHSSVVNKYIQSATLNGRPLDTPWFTHAELEAGGTLELVMGPKPNKSWGRAR